MTNFTLPSIVITVLSLGIGILVGACLQRAGLASSRTLSGFFRFKDSTAAKVVFSALATALIGLSLLGGLHLVPPAHIVLIPTALGAVVLAGLLAGAGFALAGWTPVSAATGLGAGRLDALLYLAGSIGGIWIFDLLSPRIAGLLIYKNMGVTFLFNHVDPDWRLVGFVLVAACVVCFWLAELFSPKERRYMKGRFLAGYSILLIALGASLLIFPATSAPFGTGTDTQDLTALFPNLDASAPAGMELGTSGHITPEQAADRLLGGKAGLVPIDLRPAGQFDDFHIKGARNIPLEKLLTTLTDTEGVTYLLYASDTDTAERIARTLHGQGISNILVLKGGLAAFYETCLTPLSLRPTPPAPRIAERVPTWRAYFLGTAPAAEPTRITEAAPTIAEPEPVPTAKTKVPPLPGMVSPEWLAGNRNSTKVVDLRNLKDYMQAHIPDAASLEIMNLQTTRNGIPGQLLPPAALAKQFAEIGLDANATTIILASRLPDATRFALALEATGNTNYGILSGGFPAWLANGNSAGNTLPVLNAGIYDAHDAPDQLISLPRLRELMASDTPPVLIDTRPQAHYNGTESFGPRDGHIPGAVNRPAQDDLTPDGDFKPLDTLHQEYKNILSSKDTPAVLYCFTGRQASQTWFLLTHLLGYENVVVYDGSWAEWASSLDLAVEK